MISITVDLAGHVAYGFIALGMLLLARRNRWGWAARFVGELAWVGIGVILGMSSIWSWGMFFVCLDVYGYLRWRSRTS